MIHDFSLFVNYNNIIASNPFIEAYTQSDLLGKLIFIGLLSLSIISWTFMVHKLWLTKQAKKNSIQFYTHFQHYKANPLSFDCEKLPKEKKQNPFYNLFYILKKQTLELLNKNQRYGGVKAENTTYLSPTDIEYVDSFLMSAITNQTKNLEKNLYILSTVVSLGPFLGLLGTVWGILTTFAEMQVQGAGNTNQMILGGISLALATTVLGLIDAIPALIGYNYLKNSIMAFQTDMESFSTEMLSSVEMQYRKVDLK